MRRLSSGFCALFLAFVFAGPASADDLGEPVTFRGAEIAARFPIRGPMAAAVPVHEIGPSDHIPTPFDTIILQGVLPDPGIVVEVARRPAGGAWSPWLKASVKRRRTGRFWAKAVFPSRAAGEVRVRFRNLQARHIPDLEVLGMATFSYTKSSASSTDEPAEPVEPGFPVIRRDEWGAADPREDYTPHSPERLTLHHTAGLRPETLEDSLEEVAFVQDLHRNGRGWNDIGYHFLIDAAGRIFEGRPVNVVGAHVYGKNTGNVGISIMGYYHSPHNHTLSPEQLETLGRLGRWLVAEYGISAEEIHQHREFKATACPGDVVSESFERIRDGMIPPEGDDEETPAPDLRRPLSLPARALFDGGE